MIWILGIVAKRNNGQPIDILGFGLIGNRGLVIYTNFIIAVGLASPDVVVAIRRGVFWITPLQHVVMHIPGLGGSLEKLALARLTWALHLTMNVDMDLRQVVPLVLRATGNDYYIQHTDQAVGIVATGHPLHEAFAATGAFPADFIDALEVAEESGAVVESMERLSKRYEDEAEHGVQNAHDDRRRRRGAARDGPDHPDDLPHRRILRRHDQRCGEHGAVIEWQSLARRTFSHSTSRWTLRHRLAMATA